jgi:GAF domain-containing protein
MRSHPARLTIVAVALIAIGSAAFFLIQSENEISRRRTRLRAFDLQAREAAGVLADLRAAQQAYVAAGQGVTFWMPKVASLVDEAARSVDNLRASADSSPARASLLQAGAAITEFGNVDRRARDYLKSGQQLMAGDVVFTEGSETAAQAGRLIEAGRIGEYQALDESEAGRRRRQAYALGGAGLVSVIVMVLLAVIVPQRAAAGLASDAPSGEASGADGELMLRHVPPRRVDPAGHVPRQSLPALKAAAELCTDLGRVNDLDNLKKLLVRAANMLDASGLIIWLGSASGADLRPVLAHGYSAQTLARMPAVPRSADNAAAAAYRTSALQIVLARPGASSGAVVAPLLSPEGCIGALAAEINDRGETSDAVQAFAEMFAAQLASVLATSSIPAATAGQGQIAI